MNGKKAWGIVFACRRLLFLGVGMCRGGGGLVAGLFGLKKGDLRSNWETEQRLRRRGTV